MVDVPVAHSIPRWFYNINLYYSIILFEAPTTILIVFILVVSGLAGNRYGWPCRKMYRYASWYRITSKKQSLYNTSRTSSSHLFDNICSLSINFLPFITASSALRSIVNHVCYGYSGSIVNQHCQSALSIMFLDISPYGGQLYLDKCTKT